MAAAFGHLPLVEDDDLVGVAHRGQTVRDDQAGASPAAQVVHDGPFGGGVQGAGRFVEDQEGGAGGQGACQFEALALAAAEVAAVFPHGGVEAAGAGHDLVEDRGVVQRVEHDLVGDGVVPEGQVVADRAGEEGDVLVDVGHGGGEDRAADLLAGAAAEQDLAGPGLVEAGQEAADGGLPAARAADDGRARPGGDGEAEAGDDRRGQGAVAEGDLVEGEFPVEAVHWGFAVDRCPEAVRWRTGARRGRLEAAGLGVLLHVVDAFEIGVQVLEPAAQVGQLGDRAAECGQQGLEGDQDADAEGSVDHAQAAHQEKHADVDDRKERGDHDQHGGGLAQALLGGGDLGEETRPPGEGVGFGPGRLDRLDGRQGREGGADQAAPVRAQCADRVLPGAGDQLQHDHVECHARQADDAEERVVPQHQAAVEDDQDEVDDGGGEVAGEDHRHGVVARDALGDLGGPALEEELDGQAQQMAEEAGRADQPRTDLHPEQVVLLDRGQDEDDQGGAGHRPHQGQYLTGGVGAEDAVDEDALVGGADDAGDHQEEAGQEDQRKRPPGGQAAAEQCGGGGGAPAAGAEVGARFEGEHDPGEARVELRPLHQPRPAGRVVDGHQCPAEPGGDALDHHEVLERPEDDHRALLGTQQVRLGLESAGDHPEGTGGGDQRAGLRPVPGDAAKGPQFLQGHVASVVGQHHGQAGRTALDGLHLEDGGHAVGPAPGPSPRP